MSAALHLCTVQDQGVLLPLVAALHDHQRIKLTDAEREAAIAPLLKGTPHGAAYLIGPRGAPVGYIVVSFGYSVEFGGIDAFIDEFFIRKSVRGRGMGGEVLAALMPALAKNGVRAMHLEVLPDSRVEKLYARAGFRLRDGYHLMSRVF